MPPSDRVCRRCAAQRGGCDAMSPDECVEVEAAGMWESAKSVNAEAMRIVQTDRNKRCGDPADNFAYIALCWTALLRARGLLTSEQRINEADVARMMVTMKMCRDSNAPHRDNRVDAIGYTLCLERVEQTGGE